MVRPASRLTPVRPARRLMVQQGIRELILERRFHLAEEEEQRDSLPPIVTPIALEIGDGLVAEDTSDAWALFKDYIQKVWASTEDFLAKSDPSALDAVVTVKPLGDMPGIRALGQTCVSHGMTHAGEIELVRTLIGVAPVAGV